MNEQELLTKKVINANNMINPHFTRKLKAGDSVAVNIMDTIISLTNFLASTTTPKERIYCLLQGITSPPLCAHCGSYTKLQYHADTKAYRFTQYCSPAHSKMYRDEATALTKRKKTNIERFGVDCPMNIDSIRQKQQASVSEYKNGHPKRSHWSSETTDIVYSSSAIFYLHHVLKMSVNAISGAVGVDGTIISKQMKLYDIPLLHFTRSLGETQVCEFLDRMGIKYITNDRLIIGRELDIFIPSKQLAIEYCGLYWHADFNKNINKNSHKLKMDLCSDMGIRLITLFEDEWIDNRTLVEQKLSILLGTSNQHSIGARRTTIVEVTNKQKKEFFNATHIQGNGPGSINIGLVNDGKLVACMSFIVQQNKHYLNRYATSCNVQGGFSKLIKYFKSEYQWSQIISFADQRWSDGGLYEKNGWVLDKTLLPDYCYVDTNNNRRIHKFNYRRKYLPDLLNDYNPDLSERENCDINKIPRLWDCGKLRYKLVNTATDKRN